MSQEEQDARMLIAYWDYCIYKDNSDLIYEAREKFLDSVNEEKLEKLCKKYDMLFASGTALVDNTLDSMFNLEFIMADRQNYHMMDYQLMAAMNERFSAYGPQDLVVGLKVYMDQMLRMKEMDDKDLEALMKYAADYPNRNITVKDVDDVKRERFGDKEVFMNYVEGQFDISLTIMKISAETVGDDQETPFMHEFFYTFTYEPYKEMYLTLHERKADKLFESLEDVAVREGGKTDIVVNSLGRGYLRGVMKFKDKALNFASSVKDNALRGLFGLGQKLYRKFYK